jgi:hypothetical protein
MERCSGRNSATGTVPDARQNRLRGVRCVLLQRVQKPLGHYIPAGLADAVALTVEQTALVVVVGVDHRGGAARCVFGKERPLVSWPAARDHSYITCILSVLVVGPLLRNSVDLRKIFRAKYRQAKSFLIKKEISSKITQFLSTRIGWNCRVTIWCKQFIIIVDLINCMLTIDFHYTILPCHSKFTFCGSQQFSCQRLHSALNYRSPVEFERTTVA